MKDYCHNKSIVKQFFLSINKHLILKFDWLKAVWLFHARFSYACQVLLTVSQPIRNMFKDKSVLCNKSLRIALCRIIQMKVKWLNNYE